MDNNCLMAIGLAVVKTVRAEIKYSANMDSLFEKYVGSPMYNRLYYGRYQLSFQNYFSNKYSKIAKKSLQLKTGNCGELSRIAMYLLDMITTDVTKPIYTSILYISTDHSLLLLHQNSKLYNRPDNTYLCRNIVYLKKLKNAVIVDPWLYTAVETTEVDKLLTTAENYNVKKHYTGIVNINLNGMKSIVSSISTNRSVTNEFKDLIQKFNAFYSEEKEILSSKICNGRNFNSLLQSFSNNVKQESILTSMKDFFLSLSRRSSSFYSSYARSNRKGRVLQLVINYLQDCIMTYNYPNEQHLTDIFFSTLAVCAIVRGKSITNDISADNIQITKTAKGIFEYDVVPQRYTLSFESINKLNLDWVRQARESGTNDNREQYKLLLTKISEYVPGFKLSNLYINKNGYYNLVLSQIGGNYQF